MEVKLGEKIYQITEGCPVGAPRKGTLRRNLREHGPEAFLVSRKLAPFAGCVLTELLKAGAQVVRS